MSRKIWQIASAISPSSRPLVALCARGDGFVRGLPQRGFSEFKAAITTACSSSKRSGNSMSLIICATAPMPLAMVSTLLRFRCVAAVGWTAG